MAASETLLLIASRKSIILSRLENPRETLSLWFELCSISTNRALQQDAYFSKALTLSNSTFLSWLLSFFTFEMKNFSTSLIFRLSTWIEDSSGMDTTRMYSSTFGDKILMLDIVAPPLAIAYLKLFFLYDETEIKFVHRWLYNIFYIKMQAFIKFQFYLYDNLLLLAVNF